MNQIVMFMKRYIVSIDLDTTNKENVNSFYDKIEAYLKESFTKYCKPLDNIYLVGTNSKEQTAASIKDGLKAILMYKDFIFVSEISGTFASWNYNSKNEEIKLFFKD